MHSGAQAPHRLPAGHRRRQRAYMLLRNAAAYMLLRTRAAADTLLRSVTTGQPCQCSRHSRMDTGSQKLRSSLEATAPGSEGLAVSEGG